MVMGLSGAADFFGPGGAGAPVKKPNPDEELDQINLRDTKIQKDLLPPVGSYGLIRDLVRDYTETSQTQEKERKKLDLDSFRAFPSTNLAKTRAESMKRSKDNSWTFSFMEMGGSIGAGKKTLFNVKGLREANSTVGRFQTSTKPWLDGYDSIRAKKAKAQDRMNSSVG